MFETLDFDNTAGFYYLSQPYNGSPEEKASRFNIAKALCFNLLSRGIFLFSPIVHNHLIFKDKQLDDWPESITSNQRRNCIMQFDFSMLAQAKAMWILMLPGWDESAGVRDEIQFCEQHHIQHEYFTLEAIKQLTTTD